MRKQVSHRHYIFDNYTNEKRWMSYYHQIREVLISHPDTCLIIGVGDGIVPAIIRHYGITVDTFDYEEKMSPTYCGDIKAIGSLVSQQYDCVVCCQVLEHIEFIHFTSVIKQLHSICKKRLILSLPEHMLLFSLCVYIPRLKYHAMNLIIPRFWKKKIKMDGQHYWEVGIKGKSKKYIKSLLNRYFNVINDYNAIGNLYNWFVIADKP